MSKKPELTTSKMPRETEQQYTAWLLYCEVGSIDKLIRAWDRVGQMADEIGTDFAGRLGTQPARSTIGEWSKRYRWVERRDIKLTEDLEALYKKAQEIRQKKIGYIAEVFWEKLQALRRQIKKGEGTTVGELKQLWEMFRTEMGESLGKHEVTINEDEQTPPDEEEKEFGRAIDDAIEAFYDGRRKAKTKK